MAGPLDELAYYDANIPCLAACPVHTNAGVYVAAIADGDDWTMPPTIDDPAILDEVAAALQTLGLARGTGSVIGG